MLYKTLMFMSFCARHTPYFLLMAIGVVLGNLYYIIVKKQRNRAIEQMKVCLKIEENEAKKLVRASFVNLAKNMLEILYMPKLNRENLSEYITIENFENVTKAMAEGHGLVVITGHVGTWEWMSASMAIMGVTTTAIAKPQPNMDYTRALDDLRKMVGVEVFSRGTSELLAAGRALKGGKLLGFLMDQDAGPGGAFIEFLGRTASTPMGAAVFAKKFKSPVVSMFILRQKDGRHIIKVGDIWRYEDTGDSDKDLLRFTEKMNKAIDDTIRENPTQWIWFQKRWNTAPDMQKKKHHTVKEQKEE